MKKLLLLPLIFTGLLNAAVTVKELPAEKNISYWKIENEHISAVISAEGGMLYKFVNKKTREEFVGTEGAFRDQFAPRNMEYATQLYQGKIIKNTQNEVILELTAPLLDGVNQFNRLSKTYTLGAGSTRLDVSVKVGNQKESMSDGTYEYWCNSFLGLAMAPADLILPFANGIFREKTGSNFFHTAPIAGWFGVITKDSGVVMLPEYKKFKLSYSWKTMGGKKRNTAEFRAVEEIIPAGKETFYNYAIAPFKGLNHLNGAGNAGCGEIRVKDGKLTLRLTGFAKSAASAQLIVDGKKLEKKSVELVPGAVKEYTFTLPGKCDSVQIELRSGKKLLFDLYHAASGQAKFTAREKRNAPPVDKDIWQFNPAMDYKTAHFKWLDNKDKFKALVFVDANGLRDVIELRQRMNFDTETPTLFPSSWHMSWRTKVAFTPGSPGESGVNKLMPFMAKNYDVIVIGSGRVPARKNLQDMFVSSWQIYPENVRQAILKKVKAGTGLLLINPRHPDREMEKILSSCVKTKSFAASMDMKAAPYFADAEISETVYGKGKIVVLKFKKADAFIAPLLKHRARNFQLLSQKHRFQEYQFAVISRLINYLRGKENQITSFTAVKDGKVTITVKADTVCNFEVFNQYSDFSAKFSRKLTAGKNTFEVPGLQKGANYIHAVLPGKDFAFTSIETEMPAYISAIRGRSYFEKKDLPVKARIRLSEAAKNLPLEVTITDSTGRLLFKSAKSEIEWNPVNAVVNRHIITAKLFKDGKLLSVCKKDFYLPEVFDLRKEFSNLIWVTSDRNPEYTYPEHYKQLRTFGFNFLYGGSFGDGAPLLLRFADVEVGMNWYVGGRSGLHLSSRKLAECLAKYHKTQKKEDLIRIPCPNNPDYPMMLPDNEDQYTPFCTRRLFQLGDEMSLTHFQSPIDFCFCQYCKTGFRNYLKENGWTLEKVNSLWKTNFKKWEDVQGLTFNETLFASSPAGYVLHRLYMDKVFADTLENFRKLIQKKYPGAMAGPTGVKNEPHPYGGNWNFYNMRIFDCGSYYGGPRIQSSFNRNNRFMMNYYGYDTAEGETINEFWEGLFLGERNTNNWFTNVFLLPDLRLSSIRNYYSKLLWTFRSGVGDLFYHALKARPQVAILHSQRALIANFLKQTKVSCADKEIAFARVFEDSGIAFAFIAHEELSSKLLKDYKVLVLPEASALSDNDIKVIREFAANGGKLIADYEIATLTEICNNRESGALNDLFGIKASRQVLRKVKSHTLDGITIRHAVTGVKLAGGKAAGFAQTQRGKTPLAISTKNTLYLNFAANYHNLREKAFRDLIANFVKLAPEAKFDNGTVMHGLYQNGRTRHIGLLAEMSFPNAKSADKATCQKHALKGKLSLREAGFAYDSLNGRFLGQGKKFPMTLIPGHGSVITILPYQVKALEVKAPAEIEAGKTADINCRIIHNSSLQNEDHVFLMRVFRPDGKESLEYRRIRLAKDGRFCFTFPSALNEKGVWKFLFKDAATGITASCKITVK